MARTEIEQIVVPSLLDRLTDEEPLVGSDVQMSREESERRFKRSVERDVESLLNTRRTMEPASEGCPELRESVYEFGLADSTGIPVGTKAGQDRLVALMQDALRRFEPRLTEVNVRIVEASQVSAPQMRFLVEAILVMDRERQLVTFDTVLEVASGEYDVGSAKTRATGA